MGLEPSLPPKERRDRCFGSTTFFPTSSRQSAGSSARYRQAVCGTGSSQPLTPVASIIRKGHPRGGPCSLRCSVIKERGGADVSRPPPSPWRGRTRRCPLWPHQRPQEPRRGVGDTRVRVRVGAGPSTFAAAGNRSRSLVASGLRVVPPGAACCKGEVKKPLESSRFFASGTIHDPKVAGSSPLSGSFCPRCIHSPCTPVLR